MKKWITILAAVATALAVASPVSADRERWGGSGRGPGYGADIAETLGLNLTAEQTERIDTIREAYFKGMLPLLDELNGKSQVLRNLWLAHHPDQRRIEVLQAEAQMVRDRLMERIAAYNLEVYQMLSPEQRMKVQAQVRGQGMGRMGGARREEGRMPERRKGY